MSTLTNVLRMPVIRVFLWLTLPLIAAWGAAGCSDDSALTPAAPVVSVVRLSPDAQTIPVGSTLQLTVTTFDSNDNPVMVPLSNILWKSTDPRIAAVNTNGKVTAVSPGSVFVSATESQSGIYAQVQVTVAPA